MNTKIPVLILSIFLLSCGRQEKPGEDSGQPPNILFIMADDHAYQAISAYGSDLISTPNIDRLAKEGMLFTQSFVTNSICGPSRAALLTGKFSHANGFYGNGDRFDPNQTTVPPLLQEAGYETAMIGKWHLYTEPNGFDYWRVLPGQGYYYNPDFIHMNKDTVRHEGYVTDLITDFTLEWLDQRQGDKPFCLFYHQKAPHRQWWPDSTDFDLYDGREFTLPETFYDDYEGRQAAQQQEMTIAHHMNMVADVKIRPENAEGFPTNTEWGNIAYNRQMERMNEAQRTFWHAEYDSVNEDFSNRFEKGQEVTNEFAEYKFQRYMNDYLSCIKSVDRNLGRVLDYLEKNGLADNTMVVYTSDQGFYLGEHGWFDKRFMYEESFRMPLIIRYPKIIPAGVKNDQMVQNIDFAPTFLDLAGAPVPDEMHGKSLTPLFNPNGEEPAAPWRDAVYYHYYGYPAVHMVKRHYGVRTDRYKLIHFYHDIDSWELFDLKKDPQELHNVYGDPEYADIQKTMHEKLEEVRAQYNVPEDNPS